MSLQQVQYEFILRCGKDAITKIEDNWQKIVPKLLKLCTDVNTTQDQHVNALLIIDKELRGSGTAAKLPSVFSFHVVRTCINMAI